MYNRAYVKDRKSNKVVGVWPQFIVSKLKEISLFTFHYSLFTIPSFRLNNPAITFLNLKTHSQEVLCRGRKLDLLFLA